MDNCGNCILEGEIFSCVQGCDGNYANDGTHLADDECGVCGGDGSSCLSIVDNILSEFSIDRVYPNPFNPVVNIDYSLSTSSFINILIYDLNGQIVDNLFSGYKSIGSHSIIWDAAGMSSGIYVILIKSNKKSLNKRLILSK